MDAPWPGPRLALGLNFEASAGAGHKILGWPLAWPWLALGLALAGPWPGPWLALGLALGWPSSDRFQFKPVLVQTGSGSDQFRFRPVRFKWFRFDSDHPDKHKH